MSEECSGCTFAADYVRRALESGIDEPVAGLLMQVLGVIDPSAKSEMTAVAVALFEHWKTACRHPRARPKGRVEKVAARLREGFTQAEIRQAIDYVAANPFVTEDGRSRSGRPGQRFDDLELICRSAVKLERFMELGSSGGGLERKLVGS